MTNAKKAEPLRPYQARVEFLALKEEVERKRRAGYSVRAIYEEFKNGGHLSMCYAAFCRYVRRLGDPTMPPEYDYDRLH